MPFKREDVEGLQATPEQKTELLGLFDLLDTHEKAVQKLRAEKGDADKVIARNKELETKLSEQEKIGAELQAKISALSAPPPTPTHEPDSFRHPFAAVEDMLGGEAQKE